MRRNHPAHTVRRMNSRMLCLPLAAVVALGIAVPAADAAKRPRKRSSATYMTTIHVTVDSKWSYHSDWTSWCDGTYSCFTKTDGSGTEKVALDTVHPFPVMVSRGPAGMKPILNQGTDGIPVDGESLVQGSLATEYTGPWDTANPDTTAPATGCGRLAIHTTALLGWAGDGTSALTLVTDAQPFREDCPDGPPYSVDWQNDESPFLPDILASVGKGKFLGTKQFTIRGSKSYAGVLPGTSQEYRHEYGSQESTIKWSATFRMKGTRKKHRR